MQLCSYNGGLQQAVLGSLITEDEANRRTINFNLGANAFVMEDEDLSDLSAQVSRVSDNLR